MNIKLKAIALILALSLVIVSCGNSAKKEKEQAKKIEQKDDLEGHGHDDHDDHEGHDHDEHEGHDHDDHEGHDHGDEHGHEGEHAEEVHLSSLQIKALDLVIDTLSYRNMGEYVKVNGQLEVPPQNEASVTAIIGANIYSIKVIEGDKVQKGQVLAYFNHPDLIKLQTDFIVKWNQLVYLEAEYRRQESLYNEKIGSGKNYQKAKADYLSLKGEVEGFKIKLKLLGLKQSRLLNNELYENVPIYSPISGYVEKVKVKLGQYVLPSAEMFEIVNIDKIHADLMVFEKDMNKIKKGQRARLIIESRPDNELYATIYSVGKTFEENPKAIHLHADIENKSGLLIPGTYIRGEILVSNNMSLSIPEAGIIRQDNKYYIFITDEEINDSYEEIKFSPLEVIAGIVSDGFVEVKLLAPLEKGIKVALNNAYYLYAEMKKSETEHSH